jgi:hypothetical protein
VAPVGGQVLAPVAILTVFGLLVGGVIPISPWTWVATGVLFAAVVAVVNLGGWDAAGVPRSAFAAMSLSVVLVVYYYLLSRWLATNDDWGLVVFIAFLLAGAVALGIALGVPRARRRWLGEPGKDSDELAGVLGPFTWLAVLIAIMTSVFASVTLFAGEKDLISLTAAGVDRPSFEQIAQLYVWQFCRSVPILDVTETLRWKVPFIYPDAETGTLVLLYKLAVIIPLIGAFFAYWRQQTD